MAEIETHEILFGGSAMLATDYPRDAEDVQDSSEFARWSRAESEAFYRLTRDPVMRQRYGDPERGATLAQAWRNAGRYPLPTPACLVRTGVPGIVTSDIDTVVRLSAADLTRAVHEILAHGVGHMIQLFTFDGRTGHCVVGVRGDDTGIEFFDPWPDDSLLAAPHAVANVHAQPTPDGAWRLTDAELELVLVAAFIPPLLWAQVCGEPGLPTRARFRASAAWDRLSLVVTEETPDHRSPRCSVVDVASQTFPDIVIGLSCTEPDQIWTADIGIRQSWLIDPLTGVNLIATGAIQMLIDALTPAQDVNDVREFLDDFRTIRFDIDLAYRAQDPQWRHSAIATFFGACFGFIDEEAVIRWSTACLTVTTIEAPQTQERWTRLTWIFR